MFSMIIHAKTVFHIHTPAWRVLCLTLKFLRLRPKCTSLLNPQWRNSISWQVGTSYIVIFKYFWEHKYSRNNVYQCDFKLKHSKNSRE